MRLSEDARPAVDPGVACIVNRIGVWAVVLLGGLSPLPAVAARGAPASAAVERAAFDAVQQARHSYTEAVRAYEQRRYKDAIDGFERANELAPDAAFSFNIGIAYEDMGDAAGALRNYRAYLRLAPTASDRLEVEARVERLQAALAAKGVQQLTVYSEPVGATLFIDGKPLGVTPWTGELEPGAHELLVMKRGYRDVQRRLTLPVQRALDVELSLRPEPPAPKPSATPRADARVGEGAPGLLTHVEPVTWSLFGVAAVSFGAAVGFELSRANHERDARRQTLQVDAARRLDQARSRETWAKGFTLLGAGLSATGLVLGYLDIERGLDERWRADAACGNAGCTFWYGGAF